MSLRANEPRVGQNSIERAPGQTVAITAEETMLYVASDVTY